MSAAEDHSEPGFMLLAVDCLRDVPNSDPDATARIRKFISQEQPDPIGMSEILNDYDLYGLRRLIWVGIKESISDILVVLVQPNRDAQCLYNVLRIELVDARQTGVLDSKICHLKVSSGGNSLISNSRVFEIPHLNSISMSDSGNPLMALSAAHDLNLYDNTEYGSSYILLKDSHTKCEGWSSAHLLTINDTGTERDFLKYLIEHLHRDEDKACLQTRLDETEVSVTCNNSMKLKGNEPNLQMNDRAMPNALAFQNMELQRFEPVMMLHFTVISETGLSFVVKHFAHQLKKGEWRTLIMARNGLCEIPVKMILNHQYPGLIIYISELFPGCWTTSMDPAVSTDSHVSENIGHDDEQSFHEVWSNVLDPIHHHKNALHYSAAIGDVVMTKCLLDNVPLSLMTNYLQSVNNNRDNFLHIAAAHNQHHLLREIMLHNECCRRGLNELLSKWNAEGDTPLHVCVAKGYLEFLFTALRMQSTVEDVKGLLMTKTSSGKSIAKCRNSQADLITKLNILFHVDPQRVFDNFYYDQNELWRKEEMNSERVDNFQEPETQDSSYVVTHWYSETLESRRMNWKAVTLLQRKNYKELEFLLYIQRLSAPEAKLQQLINLSLLRTRQGRHVEAVFLAFEFHNLKSNSTCRLLSTFEYASASQLMKSGVRLNQAIQDSLSIFAELLEDEQFSELSLPWQWDIAFEYMKILCKATKRISAELDLTDMQKNYSIASNMLFKMYSINQKLKVFLGDSPATVNFDLAFDIWLAELLLGSRPTERNTVFVDFWFRDMGNNDLRLVIECTLEEVLDLCSHPFTIKSAPTWSRIAKFYKDMYCTTLNEGSNRLCDQALKCCEESLNIKFDRMAVFTKIQVLIEKRARIYLNEGEGATQNGSRICERGWCADDLIHFRYHFDVREPVPDSETISLVVDALELSNQIFESCKNDGYHVDNEVVRLKLMYADGKSMDDIETEAHRNIGHMKSYDKVKLYLQLGWLYAEEIIFEKAEEGIFEKAEEGIFEKAKDYLKKASMLECGSRLYFARDSWKAFKQNFQWNISQGHRTADRDDNWRRPV